MALALVLTSLAPAGAAQAASAMVMNVSEKILYITENAKNTPDNYDFYIKNKPEDWKSTLDFKWESSDETVATVANGGITQAVGVGVTTISCTITDKETGEEVAFTTCELTVKGIADRVEIINAPEDGIVGIGENVIDLNRAMYDEAGNRTTKRGVYVSDYTRWISSDETIATIDKNGVVTTYKEGEFTVTAETYQSKANPATNASTSITLTAQASMVSAEQLSPTKAEITFDTDMSDVVTRDNLKVSSIVGTTPVNQVIRSISWDETGMVATVEVYVDFAANTEYMFEYNGMSAGFVGAVLTADTVASIAITSNTAVVNTPSAVNFKLYDANGIEITAADALARVTMSTDSLDCYFDTAAKQITFFETGRTAVVTATYHTYKYSDTGVETVYTTSATIIAVDAASNLVNSISGYHVGTSVNWNGTLNNRMSTSDSGYRIFVRALMADGTTVTNEATDSTAFTFESSDSSVLIVSTNGYLYPVREGSATIVVRYNNTVVGAVAITVIGNRTAASLNVTLSKSTLSNRDGSNDSVVVTVSAKDQLGASYSTAGSTATLLGSSTSNAPATRTVESNGTITFVPEEFTADGTYQYRVNVGNLARVFSIIVGTPNESVASTYRVEMKNGNSTITEFDLALDITKIADKNYTVDFNLAEYKGAYKYGDVVVADSYDDAVAAVKAGAEEAFYFETTFNASRTVVSGSAVTLMSPNAVSGGAITKAPTGSFRITAMRVTANTVNNPVAVNSAYLTVKDTQAQPTVTVKTQQASSYADIINCFEVKVNGAEPSGTWTLGTVVGYDATTGELVTNRPFVRNINYTANVKVNGVPYIYTFSIAVNQTIVIQ